jgi:hypothetical protein
MLKTKSRWPLNARLRYFRHEAQSPGPLGYRRPSHLHPRVLSPFRIYCKEIGSKIVLKGVGFD